MKIPINCLKKARIFKKIYHDDGLIGYGLM